MENESNPAFTLSYTGFKGADEASVIDVLPNANCSANVSSAVGNYDIVLTGGSDNNYNLTLNNGVLTVRAFNGVSSTSAGEINLYPNPASEYIFINNVPVNTTISIYTVQGTLIKNSISENATEKIDISDLYAGVYMIKLTGMGIDTVVSVVIR